MNQIEMPQLQQNEKRASTLFTRPLLDDHDYVVADPGMQRLYDLVGRLAASELAVLIVGETGVGKDHIARTLHKWSARAMRPFLALNCATIPEALVESELFGYCKGAFTGAGESRRGLLDAASGGTVFLDEIGELSPLAQAKLLRATDGGHFRRVGDVFEHSADLRMVTATNRDLAQLAREGLFRQDLFFRLSGAVLTVPPLRERPSEILLLARHFLNAACHAMRRSPIDVVSETENVLLSYPWTGNVRELKNVMEFAAVSCDGPYLQPRHLAMRLGEHRAHDRLIRPAARVGDTVPFRPLAQELEELEQRRIKEALVAAGGVQVKAASLIGMPLRTFVSKLRRYGIAGQVDKRVFVHVRGVLR